MSKVWLGVGIIVENNEGKVLFIRRKSNHGNDCFSIPGGAVELGEKIEGCALRELEEETGIKAHHLKFLGLTNNRSTYKDEGIHTASAIFYTNSFDGVPSIVEKSKHYDIGWYSPSYPPSPQFEASQLGLELLIKDAGIGLNEG